MTGAPAETWRKFTFTSTPGWAYLFGALGAAAFSSRATGHLPLTREAAKRIALVRWVFVGLIPIAILFWIAAGIAAPSDQSDTTRGAVSGFLILFGIAAIFVAFVGVLLARSYFGPSARIIERRGQYQPLVELRRVHPAFVAAVQQLQHARAAQLQRTQPPPPPPPPQSPFPPGKFSF